MFWAKRRVSYAEYAPYQNRLEKLLFAHPLFYHEFIMVSTKTDEPGVSDYFVGLPNQSLFVGFDEFKPISESDLPKEIDSVLIADTTKEPFKSRFRSRG
jgi:hypothetical protein